MSAAKPDSRSKLLIVANRLPITLHDDLSQSTKSSGGLVAALEGVDTDQYDVKWIGWPGRDLPADRQPEATRFLQEKYAATPVFMSAEEQQGFYEGYSNSSLWPLLHYMPTRFRHEAAWWRAYQDVNQRFADAVLAEASEGDAVWVHDYQLMLVPQMIKAARPSLRVGFFLHTPFPSYEVFRYLPQRNELVAGLLGADLIGFHTYGYMRHYRSCALRLLGLEAEISTIRHESRTTHLGVYPIGINAAKFNQQMDSPEHAEHHAALAKNHAGMKIVLSVERMDYTKGILHRLDAIDLFLEQQRPEQRDTVRFIFIGVPSREGVAEYQELRDEVEGRVGRLNGKYATLHNSPVLFIHGSVAFADLCAMYELADVCMVTPLIDGMNLVAKEFVACQRNCRERSYCGVLVLSEFAGAAVELHSAVVVNPHDQQAVADALRDALEMPLEERCERMEAMRERVMQHDARTWAKQFINDLATHAPVPEVPHPIGEATTLLRAAIADPNRRVALFLDYDGTLREIERDPAAAGPNAGVIALLDRLVKQRNVDTTIVSGRVSADLQRWLGHYPFGLVAEHGASIRRPGSETWENLADTLDFRWKDEVLPLLRNYSDSTPGTTVEVKSTGLVWHYRRADPEFGQWKAKALTEELSNFTANLPVHVRHGRKIVEVAAASVNKANAVMRILSETQVEMGHGYDVMLCAGDDLTDESMFQIQRDNLLTVKVGIADTRATYRVADPGAFRAMLMECLGS
ncbi:MAG TPA: bifunctional alpha,alpha-trehalose-phosphate synthase (UDP-forming)/trehalose-phosphatase [Tepidisphaeraceae bacterium]|jgi:trehalose 6-phosphate synthase/phosphatase|nr:bifunctional alpha,alpha-trehalose-phosphate synthase (UDP-forming)/trehalose-phosphatase [Tepidisphaeraceae bacterium]